MIPGYSILLPAVFVVSVLVGFFVFLLTAQLLLALFVGVVVAVVFGGILGVVSVFVNRSKLQ